PGAPRAGGVSPGGSRLAPEESSGLQSRGSKHFPRFRSRRRHSAAHSKGYPMRDPRNARLAEVIVRHSTQLQSGEAVFIESFDVQDGLVLDLIEAAQKVGAIPLVALRNNAVQRALLRGATEPHLPVLSEIE